MVGPIWAVVQARCSSSRFPDKMLADLLGRPLVAQVLARAQAIPGIDGVVLATSDHADDDALAAVAAAAGVACVRGPLDDVLQRFLLAAEHSGAAAVIRITGDCPCLDAALAGRLLARFRRESLDYLANVSPPSWPDGLDLEIVRVAALRVAAGSPERHHREHVTTYIREHPADFACANETRPGGEDLSGWHWSVDYPEDLALVADILRAAGGRDADADACIAAVRADGALLARCRKELPNEGAVRTFAADLRRRVPLPTVRESQALWERARPLIPAGTQTLSKGPTQFCDGVGPKYLVRGQGCHVWDADGNRYIDFPLGLGPVTIGHAHPDINAAVARQMQDGISYTLMHPLELALAERLTRIVPCAEQVRFGKNGSDATSACIRAARALTGRETIARCGYHGWQDWSIDRSYGLRSKGVPEAVFALTRPFAYNDLASLERILADTPCAAVVMEMISIEAPKAGFLEGVRELATRYGAVLVFDEVITGFRYARGGAQQHFGVIPDLCAMGKGLANGWPLSVVCGRRAYMQAFDEVFFSFTFGGETAALAAALATLEIMERHDYWAHAWRQGGRLQAGFDRLAAAYGCAGFAACKGMAPWTVTVFTDHGRWTGLQLKTLFQQEMLARGVLFSGSQFICLAHDDDAIDHTIAAYEEAFRVLRFALDNHAVAALTQGKVNELIFRRQ
jgi:glutamate-1-semialdehyde 2,1-aminomutase/spore coat polysaccharide biosynthesis protein SpsF